MRDLTGLMGTGFVSKLCCLECETLGTIVDL